jgi:hypothetical protein
MCLQIEKINVRRCYVSMFNSEHHLVENFSIPKTRGSGDFSIQFQCFACNPDTLVSEGYLEFNDQIWTTTIHDRFKELGARSIEIMTFQNNDGNHSAASALNRVRQVAKSQGFTEVVRGACNAKLLAKADELLAAEGQKGVSEFDEKTQAAIKMSLGEIKDVMSATKEGLLHLEEKSNDIKTSFVDMKETINKDYQSTLANQAVAINKYQETIDSLKSTLNESMAIADRKMMLLEKQNESQRYIIAKLNAEKSQTAREMKEKDQIILRLNREIHSLRQAQPASASSADQLVESINTLLAELQEGRKRKHDE